MTGGADGAVERQTWWREQLEEPDPERQLRLIARKARWIYDRAGRLLEVVRAAAAGDEKIAGLWQTINNERLARSRTTAKNPGAKTELRTGVTQAARTLWTLSGPELYVLQIDGGGATPKQYEAWLADLLITALLST